MKVLVGMSGGVDSSMAACLLKEAGYEVEGLSLVLRKAEEETAVEDAARTAAYIGIPHTTLDIRKAFREKVIEPFVGSYTEGLTPNPCIFCNRHIKFPFLLKEAGKRGAEFIATGHYAKIEHPRYPQGGSVLKKGVDTKKDQSYVLYALGQNVLERLMLPLGDYTKKDVRAKAKELGLPASERPESREICFIKDRDYAGFIEKLFTGVSGPVLDMHGKTIGTHKGIHRYTIGQRKGLGVSSPYPLYVTGIDSVNNAVHVGPKDAAMLREFIVGDLNWLVPRKKDFGAMVKVRSTMQAQPALIHLETKDTLRVLYDTPQWAPAAGQSAVFYDGDTVIGGGVIRGQ